MPKSVLDTSVVIEIANEKGKFHEQALVILKAIKEKKIKALIPKPSLAEIYYVASRLYESDQKGKNLLDWLITQEGIKIEEMNYEDLIKSGKIKKEYSVSIMDSFFLWLSRKRKCKSIFRKKEREFSEKLLKDFQIVFLSEY